MYADVLLILEAVAGLLSGGVAGDSAKRLGAVVDRAVRLAELGAQAREELREIRQLVEQLAAEQRGPTDDEVAALVARSDAAHERIQRGR